MYYIKLLSSLYELKQFRRIWYNHLSEYLLKEEYVNNPICLCVFIKKLETGLTIITICVYDLNLTGTPKELTKTTNCLKKEIEMKDLRKTRYYLNLQIEHCSNDILIHQSTYIEKMLKQFYMDKSHPIDVILFLTRT